MYFEIESKLPTQSDEISRRSSEEYNHEMTLGSHACGNCSRIWPRRSKYHAFDFSFS